MIRVIGTLERDAEEISVSHREWLDALRVRKFVMLGMAHRKFERDGRVITTVMIPPSYRKIGGDEQHTIQAALPEDN